VVVWQVEEDEAGERETEVARFELPGTDLATVAPGTAMDVLEERTHQTGQALLRRVLQAQGEATDAAAVAAHRRLSPLQTGQGDGTDDLEVASRFGRLTLRRQVLEGTGTGQHVTPGNAVLPPHRGIVITRGLQEVACLLPDTLPFVSAERLLGWQTQAVLEEEAPTTPAGEAAPTAPTGETAPAVLCASTLRAVVRAHGAALAEAEQAEVARLRAMFAREDGAALRPRLLPSRVPRRRAGGPPELGAAVDQALADGEARPPRGVRLADWERVLQVRREERDAARAGEADLRRLGPEVGPDEMVTSADEVLTRRPQRRQFWELRTARVAAAEGLPLRQRDGGNVPGHARRALHALPTRAHRRGPGRRPARRVDHLPGCAAAEHPLLAGATALASVHQPRPS